MEHAVESGVQLSVGAEINAFGDQAAAACSNSFCNSWVEPGRIACDRQRRAVQLA